MAQTFPKLTRLFKPASPDVFGIADSPLGSILAAWQGPLLVRLHVIPARAESEIGDLFSDWGWRHNAKRDDKRAEKLIQTALFPKQRWTGIFPTDLKIGFYGTDFQYDVMRKMLKIPSGKTMSYGGVANAANGPGAARAVGTICAQTPLPLVVPCHRVVAANGLGGYGTGGTAMKRQLLDWEARR